MTAKRKKSQHVVTISSLVGAVAFTLLLGGCADAYYANNGIRSPEARFNLGKSLERQGKSGYAAFIPHAAAQARRMLAMRPAKNDFPRLRAAFDVR